jgi:xanthine dehydrogenase iron-sulfur cluster and FAD-binding subunit A
VLAAQADGHRVRTIEGLAEGGALTPVQQAFVDHGALQCGFCTAGFVLAATAFLEDHAGPSRDEIAEALAGNLCRCTGYARIIDAVSAAAVARRQLASARVTPAAQGSHGLPGSSLQVEQERIGDDPRTELREADVGHPDRPDRGTAPGKPH